MGWRYEVDLVGTAVVWLCIVIPTVTLLLGMRSALEIDNPRSGRLGIAAVILVVAAEIAAEVYLLTGLSGLVIGATGLAVWAAGGITLLVNQRFGTVPAVIGGVLVIPTILATGLYYFFGAAALWAVGGLTVVLSVLYGFILAGDYSK